MRNLPKKMSYQRTLFSLLCLCIFISISAYGQYPLLEKENQFKPGIYKNLKELQENAPSVQLNSDTNIKSKKHTETFSRHESVQYFLKMKKRKYKEIGFIFGFCDGKQVYISSAQPERFWARKPFYALELQGRYNFIAKREYGDSFMMTPTPVAGGGMAMTPSGGGRTVNFYMFDMNTGEFLPVSKKSLKKELVQYPDLLNQYKDDKNRNGKTARYIKKLIDMKNQSLH